MFNVLTSLTRHHNILKEHLRIAVVYGGSKDEQGSFFYATHNPRATKTYEPVAREIADSLQRSGYRNVIALPENIELLNNLKQHNIDFVFCNSGGLQGYNSMSHLPAMLEMSGLPYVGHNPLDATLLDNKHLFKQSLADLGIPTATWLACHSVDSEADFRAAMNARFNHCTGPFIVKPTSGRASIHVHYVENLQQAWEHTCQLLELTGNTVLVEEYLPGREFVVAVSGPVVCKQQQLSDLEAPFAFSALERHLDADEPIFTSMDKRAITANRVKSADCPTLEQQLKELGQAVHHGLGLQSLIRVDMRINDKGELSVLEANPKPDLTRPSPDKTSLACHGLPAEGMVYEDLIETLLLNALALRLRHQPGSVPHIRQVVKPVKGSLLPRQLSLVTSAVAMVLMAVIAILSATLSVPARAAECTVPEWFTAKACNHRNKLSFTPKAAEQMHAKYRILFVYSKKSSSYNLAFETIANAFERAHIDVSYLVMNYQTEAEMVRRQMDNPDFDLTIVAGSSATSSLYRLKPQPAMPVVTVTAKDPVLLGLIDSYQAPNALASASKTKQSPPRRYAFTSLNTRAETLVSYLKTLNPDLSAIGILYGRHNFSALRTQVSPLARAAREAGIDVRILPVEGGETRGSLKQLVPEALEAFSKSGSTSKTRLLWLTGSTLLFDQLQLIDQLAGTTPVLATVPGLVSSRPDSVMVAIGTGFVSNARQAAVYSRQILTGKVTPDQLPVGELYPPDIAINFKKVQESHWTIPVAMFELATILFNTQGQPVELGRTGLEQVFFTGSLTVPALFLRAASRVA